MQPTITAKQAIDIFEARDGKGNPIPFSITFVARDGHIGRWDKVILAKNKKKRHPNGSRAKASPKIHVFYLTESNEIRKLHFLQITHVNDIQRLP